MAFEVCSSKMCIASPRNVTNPSRGRNVLDDAVQVRFSDGSGTLHEDSHGNVDGFFSTLD